MSDWESREEDEKGTRHQGRATLEHVYACQRRQLPEMLGCIHSTSGRPCGTAAHYSCMLLQGCLCYSNIAMLHDTSLDPQGWGHAGQGAEDEVVSCECGTDWAVLFADDAPAGCWAGMIALFACKHDCAALAQLMLDLARAHSWLAIATLSELDRQPRQYTVHRCHIHAAQLLHLSCHLPNPTAQSHVCACPLCPTH